MAIRAPDGANNDNSYENITDLDCGKEGDLLTQAITQNSDSHCRGTRGGIKIEI